MKSVGFSYFYFIFYNFINEFLFKINKFLFLLIVNKNLTNVFVALSTVKFNSRRSEGFRDSVNLNQDVLFNERKCLYKK